MQARAMDVGDLTPADFKRFPVWQYGTDREYLGSSECSVRPVTRVPVRHLVERVVGTQLTLANGRRLWALLGGIDLQDEAYTDAAIQITLFNQSERLHIVRFGQPALGGISPDQLAKILGLPASAVFPVRYDLTGNCVGRDTVLRRSIRADVSAPLAMQDHFEMIMRNAPFQHQD